MDPLSIIASVLTITGTAGCIGKGLRRILRLRHAPELFLILDNEVTGLYSVFQAVDCLVRQYPGVLHDGPISNLCNALEKSQITLFKLEDILKDRLIVRTSDGEIRLNRSVWLFAETKLRRLNMQIRADRIELSSALSLLAW